MNENPLPLGKLPPRLLARLLAGAAADDPSVIVGPGIGMDCAVVAHGDEYLVLKSDPITFASDALGEYLVQVNVNDLATTGAVPRWMLVTLLLPEGVTTPARARALMDEIQRAARALGIAVVGGHTEITHGLDRPVAVGALIGTVPREGLITPRGARPGDRILLTKGVPIEGTAILAREFPDALRGVLSQAELERARGYLHNPGISVLQDARIALEAGRVTAMHDPTEGGLAGALWELAEASGRRLRVAPARVPVPPLAARVCAVFGIDPLRTIASGALLLTVHREDAAAVRAALARAGLPCADIGEVLEGPAEVCTEGGDETAATLPWPERDDIARVFEAAGQAHQRRS